MEVLSISYSELKTIRQEVLRIVEEQTGYSEKEINLNSEIEEDLGCTGDDASELLENLQKRFDIDFQGFEFSKFFSSEGVGGHSLIIFPIVVIFYAIKWIFQLLGKPFKYSFLKKKIEREITVGDLVLTAAMKRFVLRKDVEIQLIS